MHPQNIQDKLSELEQKKQMKQKQLDQLQHRQQALENQLNKKHRSDETRLKILLGSYLIKQLKKNSKRLDLVEKHKQNLINYCQLNKNLKARQVDSQLIELFFEKLK